MKKLTILLFSILLLSASTSLYARCTCGSCYSSCCGHSTCCNHDCGSCDCCGGPSKSCCDCECRVEGRSTFVPRPQFQVGSPEYLTAFRDRMNAKDDECAKGGAMQFVLFGGKSTKAGKLASYFTPGCKTRLVTKGTGGDLDPQHFNVNLADENAEFESTIQLCPKIRTIGLGFTYRQNLSKLRDCYDPCKRHVWLEISTPLTRVETTMGLSECLSFTGEREADVIEGLDQKFYGNMTAAFNQAAWKYGKINGCCECSKTRLADISLLLGWDTFKCDSCLLEGFFGFLIPTGNERCAHYMLEPIVGHAKHWGIMKGFHLRGTLWEDKECERILEVAHDSNGLYLFSREEKRSFDLKCKPWSRYMEMYKNKEQAEEADALQGENPEAAQFLSTPGINIMTQCVCVKPRLSVTTNTSIIYTTCNFRGELGYNFFCRQSECLKLCCWKEGPALKADIGQGITNPLRTINEANREFEERTGGTADISEPLERYDDSLIKASQIDLESATHPYFFSNTLYASLGGKWDCRETPLFLDLGGSYEWGCENVVLNRWTAWIKGGFSF